jgi:hypothetical protein
MFPQAAGWTKLPRLVDTGKTQRRLREILILAPQFIRGRGLRTNLLARLATRMGCGTTTLRQIVPNEAELIRWICGNHLSEAFEATCLPDDWQGPPIDVLRAMSLALLRYGCEHADRHYVYLRYRNLVPDAARQILLDRLCYLTHNFQLALHAIPPGRDFAATQLPARLLVNQLLHLPEWWPDDAGITQDEWVCAQIGLATGIPAPDWRRPPAAIRLCPPAPPAHLENLM